MVDLDAALSDQLLDIAEGQPKAQAPADRQDDGVGGKRKQAKALVQPEQGADGWISCHQSCRSNAVTANATAPSSVLAACPNRRDGVIQC